MATQSQGMTAAVSIMMASMFPPATPSMMPNMPPSSEINTASIRNCQRMFFFRAPMDLRMPISLVRSVTLTSMMFMMPMPAASNAMAEMMNEPAAIVSATFAMMPMIESLL